MNGKREVERYFHNYSDVDDWHFVPGWLTDARRSSCAILAIQLERRRISFCYSGRGTSSRISEIFAMPTTRLRARRSWCQVEQSTRREFAAPCRYAEIGWECGGVRGWWDGQESTVRAPATRVMTLFSGFNHASGFVSSRVCIIYAR